MSDKKPVPALYEHCQRTYEKMLQLATKRTFDSGEGDRKSVV